MSPTDVPSSCPRCGWPVERVEVETAKVRFDQAVKPTTTTLLPCGHKLPNGEVSLGTYRRPRRG